MSRRTLTAVLAAFLIPALLLPGCGDQSTAPVENVPRALTELERSLVRTENSFGLGLFRAAAAAAGVDENIFISPLSASMALGMTANGAAGSTLEAMMGTLGFSWLSVHRMNLCYRGLMDLLPGLDPLVQFEIANSIWHHEARVFKQSFYDTCRAYFDAEVRGLDFGAEGAADTINAWVEEKTHGKIDQIIRPPIGEDVVMYLINAIYFLADWKYRFDPALTSPAPFYLDDGSTVTVSLMQQPAEDETSLWMYFSNDRFQAIDLPYGNGFYSMTVILPAPGVDADSLIAECSTENWSLWMAGFEEKEGVLYLPRFELEYELIMNNVLYSLGMGVAFDPYAADFTGMRDGGGLWINRVIHKTYVRVDEEGTEAAAVTAVEMVESEVNSFVMRVDRPFIFAIREIHSGAIVFVGRMSNPAS